MLTQEQIDFYHQHGYLRIPGVFTPEHTARLRDDLDWMIRTWANIGVGWTGPWRRQLMDVETEVKSKLIAMHDLHFYAQSWLAAVTDPGLTRAMAELLADPDTGENPDDVPVEVHHSTMHCKPPSTGHPFPMHQDNAFYTLSDNRYIDCLVHLNDTCHENGEIRFIDGSHKLGYLPHITRYTNDEGREVGCTPHLDQNDYNLADTVAVPAKAGDVVLFNVMTVHGSHINQTDETRRMVRVGYRHTANTQLSGQSCGRPGILVNGRRPRAEGQLLFGIAGPADADPGVSGEDPFAIELQSGRPAANVA